VRRPVQSLASSVHMICLSVCRDSAPIIRHLEYHDTNRAWHPLVINRWICHAAYINSASNVVTSAYLSTIPLPSLWSDHESCDPRLQSMSSAVCGMHRQCCVSVASPGRPLYACLSRCSGVARTSTVCLSVTVQWRRQDVNCMLVCHDAVASPGRQLYACLSRCIGVARIWYWCLERHKS